LAKSNALLLETSLGVGLYKIDGFDPSFDDVLSEKPTLIDSETSS
jgi:hypothetical protein